MVSKLIFVCVLAIAVKTGYGLQCHTYVVNSQDGFPENTHGPVTTCDDQQHFCATLTWTSTISTGEVVHFQQGTCAKTSVCQQFCRQLYRDDIMAPITKQCQHQCCTGEKCNKTKLI